VPFSCPENELCSDNTRWETTLMSETINYGRLMHRAMRQLIVEVLRQVEREGLPGNHHFFITFDTSNPEVEMARSLRQRYPSEMTIVMQDWFEDLRVMDDRFSVILNFGEVPEPIVIPFEAIRTFVDPSVEFGLKFDLHETPEEETIEIEPDEEEADEKHDAEVVSLDQFRKH
jgi:uncharacterized protein